MKQHTILSENSEHHWPHLNTKNQIVLDLGCGRHGTYDINQSSPIYLGEKGATRVIAIDASQSEIDYFSLENPDIEKYTFIHMFINDANDIRKLLKEYNPTVIKCDIEEYEVAFYDISKNELENVIEFGLEYHNLDILEKMKSKMQEWGFEIHTEAKFGFVHAPQMGVLFCKK